MKVTSSRRQIIVAALLVLAVIGAGLRAWAPDHSLARDIGTLLLVLWLPVVGNIIAFVIGRVAAKRRRHAFASDAPFTPHVHAELTAAGGRVRLKPDERHCTVVVGTDGFTARLGAPLPRWLTASQPQASRIEFLRPDLALQRLPPGTQFSVFAGAVMIGSGRVIEQLPPA